MRKELAKTYAPKEFEDRIYHNWEEKGYFHAEIDPKKKPYTIVIPPPNITGQLHMGHALDNTLQDILIRWRRMQGYSALWLPGTDHASIATEAKIVGKMKEEGLTKEQIGREEFLKRAWDWKRVYGGRIVQQLKKLGSSCDWERERFTLDEGCSRAVQKVFMDLYNKGLIYHGVRMINWCPNCKTSISDIECEYEEQDGFFWHINCPLAWEVGNVEKVSDALTVGFDTYPSATLDVMFGRFAPVGKLPLTLPKGDEVLAVNADGVCISPNDVPGFAKDAYMPDSMKDENGKAYAYRDAAGNYYEMNFGLTF